MAGLSFATALRKLWPDAIPPPRVTIFERDTREDAVGRQGYSISLAGHDSTGGLVALRDLGLLDEALKHAILGLENTGCFKIWDADGRDLMSVRPRPAKGLPTAVIRIARKHARQVLLQAVTDEVRWGVAWVSATRLENGRVLVRVAGENHDLGPDQSAVECDLLVVADGANSKIRAGLRPHDGLEYAGAVQIGGVAHFPDGIPAPVNENWGLQISGGRGVCCFYSPVDSYGVVWGLSFLESDPRPRRRDLDSAEAIRPVMEEARTNGSMLGQLFHTVVDATADPAGVFSFPARDKKPFSHDPDGTPIIFIGDSNHAVSPFAGYGASLALKDGWDLAQSLVSATGFKDAVQRYDAVSVSRGPESPGLVEVANQVWPQHWPEVLLFPHSDGSGRVHVVAYGEGLIKRASRQRHRSESGNRD